MLLSSAAVTAGTAAYTGVKPDEFMKRWLVLGPIPVSAEQAPDEDAQKKAFADDLLRPAAGESVVQPRAGAKVVIGGRSYEWRQVESTNDIIDLKVAKTPEEFSIAYAWAEIEMPEKRRGLLGIGSDDGVKAWLNGKLIHENWIGRALRPDDDVVPVEFSKGKKENSSARSTGICPRPAARARSTQQWAICIAGTKGCSTERCLRNRP
jgi:hypothetical protein